MDKSLAPFARRATQRSLASMVVALVVAACSSNSVTDAGADTGVNATDASTHPDADVSPTDTPQITDTAPDVATDAGSPCTLPDGGVLATGASFLQTCPGSGATVGCICMGDGTIHCDPGCPLIDAGTDAGTDAPTTDAAGGTCSGFDGGVCASGSSCITGYCPGGVTPVSCFCNMGMLMFCTGGCPPVPDAGH